MRVYTRYTRRGRIFINTRTRGRAEFACAHYYYYYWCSTEISRVGKQKIYRFFRRRWVSASRRSSGGKTNAATQRQRQKPTVVTDASDSIDVPGACRLYVAYRDFTLKSVMSANIPIIRPPRDGTSFGVFCLFLGRAKSSSAHFSDSKNDWRATWDLKK